MCTWISWSAATTSSSAEVLNVTTTWVLVPQMAAHVVDYERVSLTVEDEAELDREWEDRRLGDAKMLMLMKTGTTRFMLRHEQTMKILSNSYVMDAPTYCKLKPFQFLFSSGKSWWSSTVPMRQVQGGV